MAVDYVHRINARLPYPTDPRKGSPPTIMKTYSWQQFLVTHSRAERLAWQGATVLLGTTGTVFHGPTSGYFYVVETSGTVTCHCCLNQAAHAAGVPPLWRNSTYPQHDENCYVLRKR